MLPLDNKVELRDYQVRSIEMLYDWMRANTGNACLVLPTGAGKSHIVAALCKDALQNWPETRVLMLTHVKELIEQNAEKMRQHWPNAPMGIYSASVGRKDLGEPITFGGIQSLRTKAAQIGHIDLILVDECHLISHKDEGGYRALISDLTAINPSLRVVGLTATPWRLGHGLITDKPAIFDDLIEPVSIEELIAKGNLAPLRSKLTKMKLDVSNVHKRGGEYIESELQAAVDTDPQNQAVVDEVISLAGNRTSWLFFCAGVQHAEHIKDCLIARGITAATVTGETPKAERARLLRDFKTKRITALTNANVLTTGFDAPDTDMIVMLRPTMSPVLYVQMAGRGLRPKSHTDHCLVLDFAGVVGRHGPVTAVNPPKRKGDKEGDAPVKVCDHCFELVHISAKVCPACGEAFPEVEKPEPKLHDDDIMGIHGTEMAVTSWNWRPHISATSGNEMIKVTYYGAISDKPVTEYFPIFNSGYAGEKANRTVWGIAKESGAINATALKTAEDISDALNMGSHPSMIEYKMDGKFARVMRRSFVSREYEYGPDYEFTESDV
jgi:DNA repair protein RadD